MRCAQETRGEEIGSGTAVVAVVTALDSPWHDRRVGAVEQKSTPAGLDRTDRGLCRAVGDRGLGVRPALLGNKYDSAGVPLCCALSRNPGAHLSAILRMMLSRLNDTQRAALWAIADVTSELTEGSQPAGNRFG